MRQACRIFSAKFRGCHIHYRHKTRFDGSLNISTASALEARANVEVRKALMRAKSGDLMRKSKILTFLSDVYLKKEEVAVFVIVLGSISGAQDFSFVRLATFHHRSKKLIRSYFQ